MQCYYCSGKHEFQSTFASFPEIIMNDPSKAEDQGASASEAAKALSKLGASKGGKARAKSLAPEDRQTIAREAGIARWDKARMLTPEESAAIPKATHKGVLRIGDMELECYVLEDGRRILHQRGVLKALGMSRGGSSHGGDRLGKFLGGKILKPFDKKDLSIGTRPFLFRIPSGPAANGFEATILPDICELVIDAKEAGVLQKQQLNIAKQAMILHRGFARVGITALVDEATGYEKDKEKDDLQRILDLYIAEEMRPWDRRFPKEFYKHLFRLKQWTYDPTSTKRPRLLRSLTDVLVYKRLPANVMAKIRKKNPVVYSDGGRKHRNHQFLSDEIGDPHLEKQIVAVITIMRISRDWPEFVELFERSRPDGEQQGRLSFEVGDDQ